MKMICVISLHRLTHQVGEWVGLALRYMFSSVSEHSFAAINFELRCDPLRHPHLERGKRKPQIAPPSCTCVAQDILNTRKMFYKGHFANYNVFNQLIAKLREKSSFHTCLQRLPNIPV